MRISDWSSDVCSSDLQYGVKEIVYGMAHRGRLNMLANVLAKPYQVIFHEFSGGSANPDDVGGSGDVKYHLGTSTDREFDGVSVHMSLVPNPSQLEAVNPVVLGKVRAQPVVRDDLAEQHGRRSCRERVGQYVEKSVV